MQNEKLLALVLAGGEGKSRCLARSNVIEPGTVIGYDPVADAERYYVSPGGIVVTPRGTRIGRPYG
jgi:ADP-glucose pyrophosphorylase